MCSVSRDLLEALIFEGLREDEGKRGDHSTQVALLGETHKGHERQTGVEKKRLASPKWRAQHME